MFRSLVAKKIALVAGFGAAFGLLVSAAYYAQPVDRPLASQPDLLCAGGKANAKVLARIEKLQQDRKAGVTQHAGLFRAPAAEKSERICE